ATGTYTITASIGSDTATQILRGQLPGNVKRQFPYQPPLVYGAPELPHPESFREMSKRWRLVPPPYELNERSRGRFDPYNKNVLKGDYPILGRNDLFFVFTG